MITDYVVEHDGAGGAGGSSFGKREGVSVSVPSRPLSGLCTLHSIAQNVVGTLD